MIKKAIEIPDDISKWEDVVMSYMDKHYPYLSNGISNISFSKKDETTKDGVGAVQYKSGGIEITIPIIIDDGELKEPNLGIYKEQIIPISEEIFNWISSNTQQVGDLIQRDSQHISNMDYLQQTGLFEEPDMGGYKVAFTQETGDRIRKQAMLYPETEWVAMDFISKITKYATDERLVGKDMGNLIPSAGLYHETGVYATVSHNGGMPKIASDIATPQLDKQLDSIAKAASPYRRQKFAHKYADKYNIGKTAEDGATENEIVNIADQDTWGEYTGVMANDHGVTNEYKGEVTFDVKPLYEKKPAKMVMVVCTHGATPNDPEPKIKNDGELSTPAGAPTMTEATAILGDAYGVKGSYHTKKSEPRSIWPEFEKSYNMGDNVMFMLGANSYSTPYIIESKVSGLIGPKMESVTVLSLLSVIDYSKSDAIICDVPELKTIKRTAIKDHHLLSMLRTETPNVLLIPSGSVVRAPYRILTPADKGKMVSDIINGMPNTNMSIVVKMAGHDGNKVYDIVFDDGEKDHQYSQVTEKLANALVGYFTGDSTTAESASTEGKIPVEQTPEYTRSVKIASIIRDNTDAFIGAAAKLPRSISRHFAKVAEVSNIVNDLIGVSFVDSAVDSNSTKISEQVLSLINSLGNLILMSRLGKTAIPETDINRAFWALAELLNVLRG